MNSICIIDTSVFLNILDVLNKNNEKEGVINNFKEYIDLDVTFILPMATVLETGNHIAQNGDGNVRRKTAQRFCDCSDFPDTGEVLKWLAEFPDSAGRNKTPSRNEGTSFGDLSIIKEYEKAKSKFPMSEIWIWSLDSDLKNYHYKPN